MIDLIASLLNKWTKILGKSKNLNLNDVSFDWLIIGMILGKSMIYFEKKCEN